MAEVSLAHLLIKALDKADVRFPVSREELVEKLGPTRLQTSDEVSVDAAAFVRSLGPDSYENGAAFMCAVYNVSYRELYKGQYGK
jgi:hypothetical protein